MLIKKLIPTLTAAVIAAGCLAAPVCADEPALNQFKPESGNVKYLGSSGSALPIRACRSTSQARNV